MSDSTEKQMPLPIRKVSVEKNRMLSALDRPSRKFGRTESFKWSNTPESSTRRPIEAFAASVNVVDSHSVIVEVVSLETLNPVSESEKAEEDA